MITSEAEIRIALLGVLATILAVGGDWGCAAFVVLLMLPWKPIFAVGWYLVQPVVDWRSRKADARQGQGMAEIEKELDVLLGDAKEQRKAPNSTVPDLTAPHNVTHIPQFAPLKPVPPGTPTLTPLPKAQNSPDQLAAIVAIPPAIQSHVRNLPQGAFSNMDLEVEEVKFHGDLADAYVRFKSSNVSGLVIRQHYRLRKFGDHWEVESRQPANGSSHTVARTQVSGAPEIRPS